MIGEISIAGEGCTGKTGFEEKVVFEIFEFGEVFDLIATKSIKIGAAIGGEIGIEWG